MQDFEPEYRVKFVANVASPLVFLTFGRVMRLCHEGYTVERLQMGEEALAEIFMKVGRLSC